MGNEHLRERSKVTARDVARHAGVSQSAVSRAFNTGTSVSSTTRDRVISSARVLGYQPASAMHDTFAQMSARELSIALVLGSMENPYAAKVAESFAQRLQTAQAKVLLISVADATYFDDALPRLRDAHVDGVISAMSLANPRRLTTLAGRKPPIVVFNGREYGETVGSICTDNVLGARKIAKVMVDRGGRRFAFIGGREGNLSTDDRMAGYLGYLAGAGHTDVQIAYGDYCYEGGFEAACLLMNGENRPDAIFCANDRMALGALEALRFKFGLDVPRDVMVAGYDGLPETSWPSFRLTTVEQDIEQMVEEAIVMLVSLIKGRRTPASRLVEGRLIERATTARC